LLTKYTGNLDGCNYIDIQDVNEKIQQKQNLIESTIESIVR